MRPGENRHDGGQGGGVPDGLLIGIIAFLLGITLLTWTAAGLAALLAHGAWPEGLSFTRTPLAMRHLVSAPRDLPAAWPDTAPQALSGYGLFWGLLIGQLMILLVLAIFTMGTLARWKAVRARKRAGAYDTPPPPEPAPTATEYLPAAPTPSIPAPAAPPIAPLTAAPPTAPLTVERPTGAVHFAPPADRRSPAVQAIQDAEGATLVVTSDPTLWQDTKDARAKLGPVHLYDPAHLCDTPSRLHWSPTTGCEDKPTAAARATALLTPVKPTARLDQAVNDTAETLLRSYLHAAALDGRTIRHVHRWCQGTGVQEAVRTLRTHPKAAPGSAGELEAALTAHPERRDIAHELTTRALSALSVVNLREACTPNRTDALALDSFVDEGGSLYVVGESIEDPRTHPGAMPLLTALVSSVVERGRRMAERSSSGRLDPPLTLVLDDIAAVAPLPQLPDLLASGADQGLPTLALLRSREQAKSRWPHHDLPL
ncbi:type IV secretory system conjugative DNA transfer family protein [Streptomyces antibioticus]|uniref:Type VI secretion protein n=1 Tax=Streptomyces antibioticus TaxID=1890 RepID=A0AAE6Y8Q1_STRAT|nr:type IV secretory system conjugative DNA transfer family protein [Streptomyces antibioticus]OOQ51199.1 type VI secretion protein [Streptomyces antibioticus]QIT45363.1 type VI secretion protein [Streptomyces antibioticus]